MDKRRVNVRAVVWRDGKILAVKHYERDGSEAKVWCVPGGGLDPMESIASGIQREIKEELGIDADIGKLLFIQQFASRRKGFDEELELFFHVRDTINLEKLDLSRTSHGLEEIARIEFVDPKKVHILPAVLADLPIGDYISRDMPVYISSQL